MRIFPNWSEFFQEWLCSCRMETQAGSLLTSLVGASKILPSSSFHPFPHSTLASFSLYHLLVHSFKEYLSSAILVSEIAKKKKKKVAQTRWPTQHKFIPSWFWRLEAWNRGVPGPCSLQAPGESAPRPLPRSWWLLAVLSVLSSAAAWF